MAPYNVIRATSDVDLLADAGLADDIDRELRTLGYQCLHRSADVANYVRGDERVDFLFAIRPAAADLPSPASDPFASLDELMAVIEALCPVWPTRPAMTVTPDLPL